MASTTPPPALIQRLDRQGSLAHWASVEPALAAVGGVRELADLLLDPPDRVHADELFGALLRLASVDGGDDHDAALLLAQMLAGGSKHIGVQLRNVADDIDELVAGELWVQIRSFPWRTRRRGFIKGLLLDTKRAVLDAALEESTGPSKSRQMVLLVDPIADREHEVDDRIGVLGAHHVEPHDSRGEMTLLGVLEWAQRSRVISAADVTLLLELVAAGDRLDDSDSAARRGLNVAAEIRDVAARLGVSEKTVLRHRDSAVAAIRHAREYYLSEMCA